MIADILKLITNRDNEQSVCGDIYKYIIPSLVILYILSQKDKINIMSKPICNIPTYKPLLSLFDTVPMVLIFGLIIYRILSSVLDIGFGFGFNIENVDEHCPLNHTSIQSIIEKINNENIPEIQKDINTLLKKEGEEELNDELNDELNEELNDELNEESNIKDDYEKIEK